MGIKLTAKQQKFCEEYIVDLNGTQAAIRAGYSKKTAFTIANENLNKPYIQSVISELKKKISEKTGITAERVLRELEKIGFSNIQDYLSSGGTFKDFSTVDPNNAGAISSIKFSTTTFEGGERKEVQVKMWDKVSALEKIGKHIGLFEKDNEQKNKVIMPATLNFNGGNPKSRP